MWVMIRTPARTGLGLLSGEKSDLVQYLLNLTFGPKEAAT
jgi:hypothetical protein